MDRRDFLAGSSIIATAGVVGCLHSEGNLEGFVTRWNTNNSGLSAYRDIQLPLQETGTYDFDVDWGDGTSDHITSYDDDAVTHLYDEPGEYDVTIEGTLEGWKFTTEHRIPDHRATSDAPKLLEIRNWGDFDVSVGKNTAVEESDFPRNNFAGCEHLEVTADDTPVMREGSSLAYLFSGTPVSQVPGISEWDVSSITTMAGMFYFATNFDDDLSDWDVSNVRNMYRMFCVAESFDGDLSDWDVLQVQDMQNMFSLAISFNGDLSDWDVSNVEEMSYMFEDAHSFDGDIRDWDVSNVKDMYSMFSRAGSFDGEIGEWDVSNVKRMDRMFHLSGLSTENYNQILTNWRERELEDGVNFSAGDTEYSLGPPANARQYIIDEYDWDIEDGGVAE
jgi:surface protein